MKKVIVLEINEVPLKIYRNYAKLKPKSAIAKLLSNSLNLETRAEDVEFLDLYPALTWASFNTGASFNQHKIAWYNDPKPDEYPLYWKYLASNGISTGLLNTLHTSPSTELINNEQIKFLIPDCFGEDGSSETKPAYFSSFQR